MLEIKEIDYKEFKKGIYSYYKELFPKDERKPLKALKNNMK